MLILYPPWSEWPEGQKAKPYLSEHISNWVGRVSDIVSERIIHVCLLVGGFQSVC